MNIDETQKSFESNPVRFIFKYTAIAFVLIALLSLGTCVLSRSCAWVGEAEQVAKAEFGPKALLDKYEWFKNAAAQLDKKQADIGVYATRIKQMEKTYAGTPRREWPRVDLEQMNLWATEVAGVTASYNDLAADYNAQMAKFNWRFTNVGDLPAGATEALPREFKPYVDR